MEFDKFFSGYMSKSYVVKFWHFFTLEVVSRDKENGTYEHCVSVYFREKKLVGVTYRTGVTKEMLPGDYIDLDSHTIIHYPLKHFYMGEVTKDGRIYTFEKGKKSFNQDMRECVSNTFKSEFDGIEMELFVSRDSFVKKVYDFYIYADNLKSEE